MGSIATLKDQEVLETPVLLFECELPGGEVERWSTHKISFGGSAFSPRILRHSALDSRSLSDDGIDATARVSVTLANADSHFSQIQRTSGWKGAKLTVRFLFFDLSTKLPASEDVVVFRGVANPPDEVTESTFRVSFINRLSLYRTLLPATRIQRRCPWTFPNTAERRTEAVDGGSRGRYSPFFPCGYSAGVAAGVGNLEDGIPFTGCDYTRNQCEQRGMFRSDGASNPTRRFGGIEFLPSNIVVRSHGENGAHVSSTLDGRARYNDFVPLIYGSAWYEPPIIFSRNDGNLTHLEVLLGAGEIEGVHKVVVNGVEIPEGQLGTDMAATGWYNIASVGNRTGDFNLDFTSQSGDPVGDPYGGMAYLSVVVPNQLSDARTLPQIEVLVDGLRLETFNADGSFAALSFSSNPAWILLDLLRRCGWGLDDVDLGSFHKAALYCDETVSASDLYGNPVQVSRYQCNLVVQKRRSAADLVRGVRSGSGLYLTYGSGGLLQAQVESTLAVQQSEKPETSNSTDPLSGGWPAYEFGDGSNGFSGILRRENDQPSIRIWSRSMADTPNRYSVEFQDTFNEFQQDSLSLVDVDDVANSGQEISVKLFALGIPNFSQAARIMRRLLIKGIYGNLFVEFDTSVRGFGLIPGDLITLTYLKEGFERQPFRVIRVAAGTNNGTIRITCQIHDDAWYADGGGSGSTSAGRQSPGGVGLPRPLVGDTVDEDGVSRFSVTESPVEQADGSTELRLSVGFVVPRRPGKTAPGIPLLSLSADVDQVGGTLAGGRTYYYAISAVGSESEEGRLSFLVRATVPSGTQTNQVTLQNLSFPSQTVSFNVYRGLNPQSLLRVAAEIPVSSDFADNGLAPELVGPPDADFDHARFYWRLEKVPEHTASTFSSLTIGSDVLQMIPDEHAGAIVRITTGTGAGQERNVLGNDGQVVTVQSAWGTTPDATSTFVIAEPGWKFGATTMTSPVEFAVPNREGVTVQISGRSVNAHGRESAYSLSPLTRWTLGGAGSSLDLDVAARPVFGLNPTGQGTVELVAVSFPDLENTRSVQAGTLLVHFWDELNSPTPRVLAVPLAAANTVVELDSIGAATLGSLIQIDAEILVVEEILDGGLRYDVTRGSHGAAAADHGASTPVYHLNRKVFVIPFVRDFFGSPASGSFSYPIFLPDARVAAAEFFVTNSRGNSEAARNAFTGTTAGGIRTLSGGQMSIQVDGPLAIETNAAPPLIVETARSVRDVFAVVQEAPTGAPVVLELKQNGDLYCSLTILAGERRSNTVDGFGLPPLAENAELTLDVISVGQTFQTTPGSNLTLTIRF